MMGSRGARTNTNKTLTDKHKEMLPFLADGKDNSYISIALEIRMSLVIQRIDSMMDILKLADRDELVKYAKEYVESEKNI